MRLLLVEDEEKIAQFICRGLKEEGYAVEMAPEAETAWELISGSVFDLLVLDLMLPGMDGLTFCEKLRKNGFTLPILMLTAKDTVLDKVSGLDSGADDYMTKPFAFEEFLARIRALLRKNEPNKTSSLRVADLVLDLLTRKVTRGDKEIQLSNREYALLEYLMRNEGRIVTRTMISERVWDIRFDTFTNVIDVYINYLRGKIDHGFEKKLIKTVRGRGYTLEG